MYLGYFIHRYKVGSLPVPAIVLVGLFADKTVASRTVKLGLPNPFAGNLFEPVVLELPTGQVWDMDLSDPGLFNIYDKEA